jgi:hypothetical protein
LETMYNLAICYYKISLKFSGKDSDSIEDNGLFIIPKSSQDSVIWFMDKSSQICEYLCSARLEL